MRVSEDEVQARRYDPIGSGRVSFFGLDVSARRIETAARRFSPRAFASDHSEEPHYHRSAWELRDVPFCLEHWDMLQDTCFCEPGGTVQRWSRTATRIDECDACGDPLNRLATFPVPKEMRPALGILSAIVLPDPAERAGALDRLPPALRRVQRGALFDLIVRLANAVAPDAAEYGFEQPALRLGALHAACEAIRDWPRGIVGLQPAPATTERVWASTIERWSQLRVSPDDVAAPSPVGIRRGGEIARLSPEVLQAAWDQRLVTRFQRQHGRRTMPAFDPIELLDFGERWRSKRPSASVAFEFGLPRYAVEQMATLRCLIANAPSLEGKGFDFMPSALVEFLEALGSASQPIDDPVPLRQVMRTIGGGLKPWGLAVRFLLEGRVAFDIANGRRLIDRIVVARRQADRISCLQAEDPAASPARASERIGQVDALEVLNAALNSSHLLDGLPTSGNNPRTFLVADVIERSSEIVTAVEIGAVLGIEPASAWQHMRRLGLSAHPICPSVWPRAVLEHLR